MLWLKDKYQEEFAKIAVKEHLPKGYLLDNAYIYYLQSGFCVLGHTSERGDEKVLVYFREKALMGFLPYLIKNIDDREFAEESFPTGEYFIKTRSACDVLKVEGEHFFSVVDKTPALYRTILCTLTQNYANIIDLLTRIINKSAPVRVCRIIEEFKIEEQGQIVLPRYLTYYDIGIFASLHVITVTKIFKALLREQIIRRAGRTVIICQAERINEIANEQIELRY